MRADAAEAEVTRVRNDFAAYVVEHAANICGAFATPTDDVLCVLERMFDACRTWPWHADGVKVMPSRDAVEAAGRSLGIFNGVLWRARGWPEVK